MADRYVMVPAEATEEMNAAGARFIADSLEDGILATPGAVYAAMIAARPAVGEEVVERLAKHLLAMERHESACLYLPERIAMNPFDPLPHDYSNLEDPEPIWVRMTEGIRNGWRDRARAILSTLTQGG